MIRKFLLPHSELVVSAKCIYFPTIHHFISTVDCIVSYTHLLRASIVEAQAHAVELVGKEKRTHRLQVSKWNVAVKSQIEGGRRGRGRERKKEGGGGEEKERGRGG